MTHTEVIRELTGLWNAGDIEAAHRLYTDDAEIRTGPHWPELVTYRGREEIRATSEEWASMWDSLRIELYSVEEHGDKVLATGAWKMRAKSSGVSGDIDCFIVCTMRDGKIAVLEWFEDRDTAVAAARDS